MLIMHTINGTDYTFICDTHNTQNGFKHYCELYEDYAKISKATKHYINRTWERYTYQSVMIAAVQNRIDVLMTMELEKFKRENNYKRLTQARQKEFEDAFNDDAEIIELKQLKALL